jgi:SAM-dependent methyltransferase
MPEDQAASSDPAKVARTLVRDGPGSPPPGAGPVRRLVRRILLRILRPYTAHQQMVDNRLLDALHDLERQMRTYEGLNLELLTEDLVEALNSLRARVAEGEEAIAGARAIPYAAPGALGQFRDPDLGVVLGYRQDGHRSEDTYREFEEVFRGPEERVRQRQRRFLELLDGHEPVLDVGCGRGEFLDLLREHGLRYMGVDLDDGMVDRCRAKGHTSVEQGTGNDYLARIPDESLGAVFSAQVIEHIPYPELLRFLELSHARLREGGLFVAETVNPHAPHALKTFWVDPTHQHPLFPETVLVLCRIAGFGSAHVFHPLGTGHVEDDRYHESEYAVVATKT